MAFGLNPKLNETEKNELAIRREVRRLSRRERLYDYCAQRNRHRENLRNIENIKAGTAAAAAAEEVSGDVPDKADLASRWTLFLGSIEAKIGAFTDKHRKGCTFAAAAAGLFLVMQLLAAWLICYDVHFNGHYIGTVPSLSSVNRALDIYQAEKIEEYQLPSLYFERTITSKRVLKFSHRDVLNTEEIYGKVKESDFPFFCKGAVITINGQETIKLASRKDAQEAIDTFSNLFSTSSADWFTLIDIKEITTEETLGVKDKIISIGSDYSVEEAVQYLSVLAMNGMNSYHAPKDAKTVVTYELGNATETPTGTGYTLNYEPDSFFTTSGIPTTSLIFAADLTPKTMADTSLSLNMVAVEEVDYIREDPFEIHEYQSSSHYKGELLTTTEGVNGQSRVHAYITSVNGIMISEEILEQEVLVAPVTEERAVGTKDLPAAYSEGKFVMPTSGSITSTARSSGSHSGFHAVDIANRTGTGIYAADSGVVAATVHNHYSYGNYIIINHSGGYSTLYAHLSYIGVSVGQRVGQLEWIGRMGSTGNSTGPHLHFEIRLNGSTEYLPAYFDVFNRGLGTWVYVGQSGNPYLSDKDPISGDPGDEPEDPVDPVDPDEPDEPDGPDEPDEPDEPGDDGGGTTPVTPTEPPEEGAGNE